MSGGIAVWQGDITQLAVDAIVNAANETLLGGGGVDGAIHRAAGPGLLAECKTLGGCATGQAKATGGHDLPAKYVIHTVGPVWRGGAAGEDDLLAACYRNALALAADLGCESLAFPAISTGVYGFPAARAAHIAVTSLTQAQAALTTPLDICLVAFDATSARVLTDALRMEERRCSTRF